MYELTQAPASTETAPPAGVDETPAPLLSEAGVPHTASTETGSALTVPEPQPQPPSQPQPPPQPQTQADTATDVAQPPPQTQPQPPPQPQTQPPVAVPNALELAQQKADYNFYKYWRLSDLTYYRYGRGTKMPTATSAVVDMRTGRTYYGKSGNRFSRNFKLSRRDGKTLRVGDRPVHPSLQGFVGTSPGGEPWSAENCAEFDAINKALNAGIARDDMSVATVRTIGRMPFAQCQNCRHIHAGIHTATG